MYFLYKGNFFSNITIDVSSNQLKLTIKWHCHLEGEVISTHYVNIYYDDNESHFIHKLGSKSMKFFYHNKGNESADVSTYIIYDNKSIKPSFLAFKVGSTLWEATFDCIFGCLKDF